MARGEGGGACGQSSDPPAFSSNGDQLLVSYKVPGLQRLTFKLVGGQKT